MKKTKAEKTTAKIHKRLDKCLRQMPIQNVMMELARVCEEHAKQLRVADLSLYEIESQELLKASFELRKSVTLYFGGTAENKKLAEGGPGTDSYFSMGG